MDYLNQVPREWYASVIAKKSANMLIHGCIWYADISSNQDRTTEFCYSDGWQYERVALDRNHITALWWALMPGACAMATCTQLLFFDKRSGLQPANTNTHTTQPIIRLAHRSTSIRRDLSVS
jgi:hypothetical protein